MLELCGLRISKSAFFRSWVNASSLRLKRRVLVFESDDWGAIRMRDKEAFRTLQARGVLSGSNPYDRLDCLEAHEDLEALFNVLSKGRSGDQTSPRFTFNMVMANPNFSAIAADGFSRYVYENLFESYVRYTGDDLRETWKSAVAEGIAQHQFHGREHLNVGLWLDDLRKGHKKTMLAFEHQYFGHTTETGSRLQKNYLAALWPGQQSHLGEIKNSIVEGLDMFERQFRLRSSTFVPCKYVLPKELEPALAEAGIQLIQSQRGQRQPSADGSAVSVRRCYTGKRNCHGQVYSVRNVRFEPFESMSRDWVNSALDEIRSAFFWGSPAIISTHRINYVGGMDIQNRDRNLRLLDTLLDKIVANWPDVEFLSSDELLPMLTT